MQLSFIAAPLMVCLYVCVCQVWGDIHPTAANSGHPPDLCRGGDQGQHHKTLRPGRHGNGLLRLSPSASEHERAHRKEVGPGLLSFVSWSLAAHIAFICTLLFKVFSCASSATLSLHWRILRAFVSCPQLLVSHKKTVIIPHTQVVSVCSASAGLQSVFKINRLINQD